MVEIACRLMTVSLSLTSRKWKLESGMCWTILRCAEDSLCSQ